MMTARLGSVLALFVGAATTVAAQDVRVLTSTDPALAWASVTLADGKVARYTHGIGSGAFRHPSDPADQVWTVGDRGPNMTCREAETLLGKAIAETCAKQRRGRVYPTPDYVPSIYRLTLDRGAGTFAVAETIPVKTKSGRPIRGLLNPQTKATKDTSLDLSGQVLADDPDHLDLEAIVRLADGTFWVAEEMGPSLARLSADGRILERLVPADAVDDYKGSEAEIVGAFPAILSKRQGNRGFESLAVSPDERFLYVIMQNPLANPDAAAFDAARNARLFKLDIASRKLVAEYVYQLDDPRSFALDPSEKQSDPRISEMLALGPDRLLVLERTEATTKLHEITLTGATDILAGRFDDAATRPTLEQSNDLSALSIVPVTKLLRFDQARDFKAAPGKIEGLALLGDGTLLAINDNDFGIRGDVTQVLLLRGFVTADRATFAK